MFENAVTLGGKIAEAGGRSENCTAAPRVCVWGGIGAPPKGVPPESTEPPRPSSALPPLFKKNPHYPVETLPLFLFPGQQGACKELKPLLI